MREPDRRLNRLLGSSAFANLGDGIAKVAFPLLAATLTRDPVLIAGLSAAQFLPWLLFGLLAGAMLDRVDRRKAVVLANTVRAVAVGGTGLLVYVDSANIWVVYVAALAVGIAETVADSATNVLIPSVVERAQLSRANSKLQATEIVGQTFLGGPVGSLAFAVFAAFPFLLDSLAFALGAALLAAMAGNYRPRREETATDRSVAAAVRSDIVDGLRWVRRNTVLRRLVVVAGLVSLVSELAQAQLVLYALEDLHLSNAAYGVFASAGGVGGLAGAAVASRLIDRFGSRSMLVTAIALCGTAFFAMGFVSNPVLGGVLFGLFAAAIVTANVILATVRHTLVPEELLGRVLGVWRTVVWGALPVGALLGGVATRLLDSPSATFALSGVLLVAVAWVAWRSVRDQDITPIHPA